MVASSSCGQKKSRTQLVFFATSSIWHMGGTYGRQRHRNGGGFAIPRPIPHTNESSDGGERSRAYHFLTRKDFEPLSEWNVLPVAHSTPQTTIYNSTVSFNRPSCSMGLMSTVRLPFKQSKLLNG